MFNHLYQHPTGFQTSASLWYERQLVILRLPQWIGWLFVVLVATACSSTAARPEATATPPATPPPSDIFFPQQAPLPTRRASMAALIEGLLVVDKRCLRVIDGDTSYLPIWPAGVSLYQADTLIEIHTAQGQIVARVGEPIFLGGGEVPADALPEVIEPVIQPVPADCPGPYWVVADSDDAISFDPPTLRVSP